jgi:exodeoxyribonuclease-5
LQPIAETYGIPHRVLAWSERHAYGEFDYGYAITCHKSQGSEWDSLLVIEEPIGKTSEERAKWLYTAVTRAKKHLTIVRL